jgi:hypothetical protein
VSWKPAVPPPPVTGAAGGIVLGGTVTVCVTVTWGDAEDAGGLELTPGVPDAEALPDSEELPDEGVVPEEAGAVPDAVPVVTDGEKTVGVEVDVPEVHAETATGTSRVRAPQQRAVSLALSGVPAIVPRTFMDPSSCAGQMTIVFPFPAAETGIPETKTRDRSGRRPRRHRQVPKSTDGHMARPLSGADVQWPVHHRNIRLTE